MAGQQRLGPPHVCKDWFVKPFANVVAYFEPDPKAGADRSQN